MPSAEKREREDSLAVSTRRYSGLSSNARADAKPSPVLPPVINMVFIRSATYLPLIASIGRKTYKRRGAHLAARSQRHPQWAAYR